MLCIYCKFIFTDSLGGVVLALQCIVRDHRNRNLQHYLKKPILALARLQQADGGFGSLHNTALAIQVSVS